MQGLRKLMTGALAAGAIVAGAGSASAGDWGGLYIGGSVGGAWSNIDWEYFNLPGQTLTRTPSGMMAGVHVGIQHQWNRLVLGVEGSYSGSPGQKLEQTGPDAPIFAAAFDASVRIRNLLTLGPRVGWAFDKNFMGYVTGGYASSHIDSAFFAKGFPQNAASFSARSDGWFIGGGLEYALTKNWLIGVDYKHVELDTEMHTLTNTPATGSSHYISGNMDVVTARLTFKLGRPDEVMESLK